MEKQKIEAASAIIDTMGYVEKKKIYTKYFSLGTLNGIKNVNDKLILISIVSFTYLKMLEKDPQITPLAILMKITNQRNDGSVFYQALEGLSVAVEDFCYGCTTADTCGLKSSAEIVNKIKEILNTWAPF